MGHFRSNQRYPGSTVPDVLTLPGSDIKLVGTGDDALAFGETLWLEVPECHSDVRHVMMSLPGDATVGHK